LARGETQRLHPAKEFALFVTDIRKRAREGVAVPGELGPAMQFVDEAHNRRTSCGDYGVYSPHVKLFTAHCALNNASIHRMGP
jgi:hypothetical protein